MVTKRTNESRLLIKVRSAESALSYGYKGSAEVYRSASQRFLRHQAAQNKAGNEPRGLFNDVKVVLQQQRVDVGA